MGNHLRAVCGRSHWRLGDCWDHETGARLRQRDHGRSDGRFSARETRPEAIEQTNRKAHNKDVRLALSLVGTEGSKVKAGASYTV